MSTIVTRSGKGSPLTNQELDNNFTSLNTDKAELSGAAFAGAITTNSTFDGRDVATDGTKLDGVEASADVTDATNVTAAGALMDSELTSIASVKALNQGVATGDSPTFAAVTSTGEITANGGIALGDSDAATFGDSDDLSISHAGGNTYLTNTTGSLVLRSDSFRVLNTANSEQILHGDADGAVSAYYNNALKLATTATGTTTVGTATMDGLVVDGDGLLYSASNVQMRGNANVRISLGTAGTSGANNSSNWIYGNGTNLRFNNAGGFYSWETLGTERMRIDSAGRVTQPYQPSASVFANSGDSGAYNNASSNADIVATGIGYNTGSHYSTSTGRFTAPVAGRYMVTFGSNFYTTGAGGWIMPQIRRNSSVITRFYDLTVNRGTWMHISGSTIINCSVGDYLTLFNSTASTAGGGIDVGPYSTITFHLLG
jgi:hypothetical protein